VCAKRPPVTSSPPCIEARIARAPRAPAALGEVSGPPRVLRVFALAEGLAPSPVFPVFPVFLVFLVFLVCLGSLGCGGARAIPFGVDSPSDAALGPDTQQVLEPSADGRCVTAGAAATTPNSAACTCDNECASGFCTDGVCCASACNGTCLSCALPGNEGQCLPVPAGLAPTDPTECPITAPSTCGTDGTCDGDGACRLHLARTPCKGGKCAGDGITGGFACDGNGACAPSPLTPCFPYTCSPTTNDCATSCTTNAECAAGQQCVNNACGKALNGQVCQTNDRCASGFCVDGVCCNVACAGECMSCNQPGKEGTCGLLAVGLPDPDFCKESAPATCGATGRCDGLGACAKFPATTLCGPSVCAGDATQSPAQLCDGIGNCRAPQEVDCSPFRCAAGACNRTCASDADCIAGHPCVSSVVGGMTVGQCSGKKANGQVCAAAAECASAACVDGVCCESACTGPCRSCGLAGSLGRCMNAAAGTADPRKTCVDQGKAACGANGLCDGGGACQKYPAGTACAGEKCSGGTYTPAATCTAAGQCATPTTRGCSPFVCTGTKCFANCSTSAECAAGFVCTNGSCGLKNNGQACSAGSECSSTHCAQGVCCDTTCKGACTACNVGGSVGTCRAVSDGTPDPQGVCAASAQSPCGQTGMCRAGACAVRAAGTACGAATCNGFFSVTPAPICDGAGACQPSAPQFCSFFGCLNGACR